MKKGKMIITLFIIIMICGCGKKQTEIEIIETQTAIEATSEEVIEQKLVVYSGNDTTDGLMTKEVVVAEIKPEILIEELIKSEMISQDTQILTFSAEDPLVLKLDLSESFEQGINGMGTAGEYLSIASLVNTFLDAYQGNSLILSIEGKPLETGHNIYEEPFTKFPLEIEKQTQNYEILEETIEDDKGKIKYPKIVSAIGEEEKFIKWNEFLEKTAIGDLTTEGRSSYQVNYEVMTQDEFTISIVFRGEYMYQDAPYPTKFAKTVNIDLVNDTSKRLFQYGDIDHISQSIEIGNGYQVLSEEITNEDLAFYFKSIPVEELPIILYDYDYDIANGYLIPTGYSYIKDNKTVIIMNVAHAMGDYVEIEF